MESGCVDCAKKFVLPWLLTEHVEDEKLKKKFFKICSFKTLREMLLNVYVQTYNCDSCEKGFSDKSQLTTYKQMYHEGGNLVCEFCSEDFKTQHALKLHLKEDDPLGDTRVTCPKCSKKIVDKNYLKRHMEIYNENRKRYICDVCGKIFKSLENLYMHKTTHNNGTTMYVCEVCGKKFRLMKTLKVHRTVHTKERLYTCEEFQMTFTLCSGTFKMHMRSHICEKQFKCHVCSSEFSTTRGLFSHMRSH